MSDAPNDTKAGLLHNNQDNKLEEPCPWYINSKEHHNCFWLFVLDRSELDGSMPELTQSEMATLLNCSTTKIHFLLKDATQALTEILQAKRTELAFLNEDTPAIFKLLSSFKVND